MKTRGKAKVDNVGLDNMKDLAESRDMMDDTNEGNGYENEKMEEIPPVRTEKRSARNPSDRRQSRAPRSGNARGKSDKQLMDSEEFQQVVQGFFEFIQEMQQRKKKQVNGRRKQPAETRPYKLDEPETNKRVKLDGGVGQPKTNEKGDQIDAPTEPGKTDNSIFYRFKDSAMTKPEVLGLLKDQGGHQGNFAGHSNQNPSPKGLHEGVRASDKAVIEKPGGYTKVSQDLNQYPSLLDYGSTASRQVANKSNPSSYMGYDNNALLQDLMQRIRLQNFGGYLPPNPPNPYDIKNASELIMLEALLQNTKQSNLLNLLGVNQPNSFLTDVPLMMLQNQARFGNQGLGIEHIQVDPDAGNPKTFEGKLGRAATHVAIAYFIYFKSLDPDVIAKSDKCKMDPTYNAKMLKEKKHEPYAAESALSTKMIPGGLDSRLVNLGLGSLPLDYIQTQDLQRLMAQQGLSSQNINDQLREAQLQRLQQENMRNDEMQSARLAMMQNKNEIKLEEEKNENMRRRNENRQGQKQQVQPKEEEIIEINENSDSENKETKNEVIEVKEEKSETGKKDNKNDQAMQIETVPKSKGKSEDTGLQISAEDIVEEITELTNPQGSEFDKNKKRKSSNANKRIVPPPKKSEEGSKPGSTQNSATQKPASAMLEEIESTSQNQNEKAEPKAAQTIEETKTIELGSNPAQDTSSRMIIEEEKVGDKPKVDENPLEIKEDKSMIIEPEEKKST